ncbi:MAG: acetate/propionate family kinase [Rhodospirillaceae bacterium]|nr:acetate/propionate family kinase [Rhodospirillaceae bacterium]MBT6205022.1 acetate/propionate family kinase [Rhodospirillaceae bacterium]MBT6509525.1 acetate/propionate family kinase [Rhodospirillaceae bacterium]MBT7612268.1 acetate/propionate family kinase [Rhodospirillaceae bacterium]MBT7648291.1 acetate/propionate family kinase [Rhodospirillaceae bacterium]
MADILLALNCGSSSVKFAAFDDDLAALFRGQVENIGEGLSPRLIVGGEPPGVLPAGLANHADIIAHVLEAVIVPRAGGVAAVGHRVVHGGTGFGEPVLIDPAIRAEIEALAPLAPSHQPHNLAGIDAIGRALPGVPQVACFDTAFHRTIPEHRQVMPLPQRFADEGLRRFGFHGLSYQRIVASLPAVVGERATGRTVVCHLGNGCSLTGVVGGKSVYTSMGFTPLDGLMMGTRPGRLDPGAVLWLVERHGGDLAAVDRLLNRESGLLGVSGLSSDMRSLLGDDSDGARRAVTMFVDRLVQEVGSAAAAMGGLDLLVFTGGIGEHAVSIRALTVSALRWLGFQLDEAANARHATTITKAGMVPSAHVIATDEEAVIATAMLEHSRTNQLR